MGRQEEDVTTTTTKAMPRGSLARVDALDESHTKTESEDVVGDLLQALSSHNRGEDRMLKEQEKMSAMIVSHNVAMAASATTGNDNAAPTAIRRPSRRRSTPRRNNSYGRRGSTASTATASTGTASTAASSPEQAPTASITNEVDVDDLLEALSKHQHRTTRAAYSEGAVERQLEATELKLVQANNAQAAEETAPPAPRRNTLNTTAHSTVSSPGAFAVTPTGGGGGIGFSDDDDDDTSISGEWQSMVGENTTVSGNDSAPTLGSYDEEMAVANPVDPEQEDNLPEADQFDSIEAQKRRQQSRNRTKTYLGIGFVVGACLLLLIVVFAIRSGGSKSEAPPSPALTEAPTGSPTMAPTSNLEGVLARLPPSTLQKIEESDESPQAKALKWLQEEETYEYPDERRIQRFALATIYYALGGENWFRVLKPGWLDHDLHECEWSFTKDTNLSLHDPLIPEHDLYLLPLNPCSHHTQNRTHQDHVYKNLWLPEGGLRGSQIPGEELALLTGLQVVHLGGNKFLEGSVPTQVGLLSDLEFLELGHNTLMTGALPTQIGLLRRLKNLRINDNQGMHGHVPTQIGRMESLEQFFVAYSNLSGTLPSEMGLLRKAHTITLDGNALTGSLPTQLGQLHQNLKFFGTYGNEMTGTIPSEIGLWTNARFVGVPYNYHTGPVPTQVGNLESVAILSLRDNFLSGSIPSQIGQLGDNLTQLHLYGNQLTSTLPAELFNLHHLELLYLYNNQLTGSIPNEVGQLEYLYYLKLQNNSLTGTIPATLAQIVELEELELQENELTGPVPTELGGFSYLYRLNLADNRLTGTIPSQLAQTEHLEMLYLANNELTGLVPLELGLLEGLAELDVSGNEITGEIPEMLGAHHGDDDHHFDDDHHMDDDHHFDDDHQVQEDHMDDDHHMDDDDHPMDDDHH